MKRKQITLLLIISVSMVWGVIFYRVFSSAAEELPERILPAKNFNEQADIESYPLTDTFKLVLNYRDPFLGENAGPINIAAGDETLQHAMLSISSDVPTSELVIPADIIVYHGHITNPDNRKIISIITLNGKEQMLEEGQFVSGLKLLKNYRDSVKISYRNKTRFIRLK